ncbi:hypothetical protein BS78_04G123500 [Paspalum vaginatum]|nr:hypothetical protein BS78_04G123500 [Paspalum vaginatum]
MMECPSKICKELLLLFCKPTHSSEEVTSSSTCRDCAKNHLVISSFRDWNNSSTFLQVPCSYRRQRARNWKSKRKRLTITWIRLLASPAAQLHACTRRSNHCRLHPAQPSCHSSSVIVRQQAPAPLLPAFIPATLLPVFPCIKGTNSSSPSRRLL